VCLEPGHFNVPSFGHVDFFRASRSAAWPIALDWLGEGKSPQPAV